MFILEFPELLPAAALTTIHVYLDQAQWVDGGVTAGGLAKAVKHNRQLADNSPVSQNIRNIVGNALSTNQRFRNSTFPRSIVPPRISCYGEGDDYGFHIDSAMQAGFRTDLAATLFLSDPTSYDGGELIIARERSVKLKAGGLVVYPADTIHRVAAVTRGVRYAAVFWIESMIRNEQQRRILFDLSEIMNQEKMSPEEKTLRLSKVYNNLVRQWAFA